MFVRSHNGMHGEWELVKWLVLFALAGAIALASVGTVTGAGPISQLAGLIRSVM